MRLRYFHHRAAWLCIAAQLMLGVGISSLVLCVGEEGHIAIESRFAEDCCDDARAGEYPTRLARPACDCSDSSLQQPAAGLRASRDVPTTVDLALAPHPAPPVRTTPFMRAPSRENAERGSPGRDRRRTIVLLV